MRIETKKKYGKMPVLIFDNVNKVTDQDLETLQDYAKRVSDSRKATIVFVSSDGRVPQQVDVRSAGEVRRVGHAVPELQRA